MDNRDLRKHERLHLPPTGTTMMMMRPDTKFGRMKTAVMAGLGRFPKLSAQPAAMAVVGLRSAQSRIAPLYRRFQRTLIVIVGFVLFATAEIGLAWMIKAEWSYLIIVISSVLVAMVAVIVSPTWGFVIWLFLSPFAGRLVQKRLVYEIGFDTVLLALLALCLVIRSAIDRKKPSGLMPAEWLMIASFVYTMVLRNSAVGTPPYYSQLLITPMVVYFIARAVVNEKGHITLIALALLAIGTIWAGFGIYEHFAGASWLSLAVGKKVVIHTGIGEGRSTGPAGHYYLYGNAIILSVLLATHFAAWTNRATSKACFYALWPVLVLGLYFGYSRAPFIAFVLALLTMTALARAGFRRYVTAVIVMCVAAVALAPLWLTDAMLTKRMSTGAPLARFATNITSMNMLRAHPLFGVGLGEYVGQVPFYVSGRKHSFQQYTSGLIAYWGHPHSEYFLVLCEQGIIGAILHFGTLIAFIAKMFRIRSRLNPRGLFGKELPGVVIAFTFAVLLTMVTDDFQSWPYMYFIMFTMFATMVRLDELSVADIPKEQESQGWLQSM